MKILLIAPRGISSDRVNFQYLFPLGLAYISSVLKQAGHKVTCLNHNHFAEPIENLLDRFFRLNERYDFICTGGLSPFYRQIKMIVDAVHKLDGNMGIILGGGIVSSEPELMFDTLKPDYIVIGEGEKTILELIDCLEKKGDISNIAGIGYRGTNNKFVCNKAQTPIMDLDNVPLPDFEGFDFGKYLDNLRPTDQYFYDLYDYPRVYPIICSRSCPFLCTFCFHPLGNKYRQRSVDSIMRELTVMVKRYRINTIAIYDELFSNNLQWVYKFCHGIKDLFRELSWECKWSCQMRVDKVDDEMLKVMKDSGCYMVSYGFESYSQVVLRSMKKYTIPQQIDRAVNVTLRNNVSIQGNFIFGDVAETTQTAHETLDYWKRNSDAGILLGFIRPYPGTELYQSCLERKIIKDKLDFIANHINDVFNMTKTMTGAEFKNLEFDIYHTNLKYRTYATPNSLRKMEDGTFDLGVRCPYCAEIIKYKNFFILSKFYFFIMVYCRFCRRRFFLVSGLYKFISKTLILFYRITPGILRVALYDLFQAVQKTTHDLVNKPKIKQFIKRYILKVNR